MGYVGLGFMATAWMTTVWIGTDMFLPALPTMVEELSASQTLVNMIIFVYEIALAIGALIGGSISDRLGRRVPMLNGAAMFSFFTLLGALVSDIWVLLVARAISGFGGGVICAAVMAILKDEMGEGPQLDKAVTLSQSFVAVGPIVAPFVGSLMLGMTGWHGIFLVLAGFSFVLGVWYAFQPESLPIEKRAKVSIIRSLGLVFDVAKNKSFTVFLFMAAMPVLGVGVFIATSSYIIIEDFGLDTFGYSVCYGIAGLVSVSAPFVYLWLSRHFSSKRMGFAICSIFLISALLVLGIGPLGIVLLVLSLVPFYLAEGMMRPYACLVLLRAEKEHTGSASALINFALNLFCALGVPVASIPLWGGHYGSFAWPLIILAVISFATYLFLIFAMKSEIVKD
ncbi:MAG: MFS transporter [Eggerthellaceae bacterium]|nr:MFS transporter [Eggerthellaceae bacterium]